jgi:hypothetical protein
MNASQREELKALAEAAPNGLLKRESVVEFARDRQTALHAAFEWNDKEAAVQHRLHQAGQLIRVYVQFEPMVQRKCRALISVPSDRAEGGGYRRTPQALANPVWLEEMLQSVRKRIESMRQSNSHLRQLDSLWPRLDAVIDGYLVELNTEQKAG